MKAIRNFSIIAHIDHGKSTLSDRLIQTSGVIPSRQLRDQLLDTMDIERERGVTIKSQAIALPITTKQGTITLNLIDTPGHVDFAYEVTRALSCCEGVLLLVDASQGVQAQTLANLYIALDLNLEIIPVINKIDLPSSDVNGTLEQIFDVLKIIEDPVLISAKSGEGCQEVLDAVVREIPAPKGDPKAPLAALIFDSSYSTFRGVILLVRVVEGTMKKGMRVRFFSTGTEAIIEEVGFLKPKMIPSDALGAGETGYMICGIKDIHTVRVGDTVMEKERQLAQPLPGYKEAKPVVFAGIFPIDQTEYTALKYALDKLNLEDSSFNYTADSSQALGFGYRLGFLGLLHMDIVKERLSREFNLDLIVTAPNVIYRVQTYDNKWIVIDNPAKFPPHGEIKTIEEPYVLLTIVLPIEHQEPVLNLIKERRGVYVGIEYLSPTRMLIKYELPLAEMVVNFYDRLKSVSKGYATLDYQPIGDRESDMVKLEILIHAEPVDALSQIVHKDKSQDVARKLCEKLKELIDRQNFEVAIQGRVDGKIIARETIGAKRKDVIAKCYGGDITRKKKLLGKQKEGKKRAKMVGSVEVPQEAFLAVLKIDEDAS